MNKIYSISNFSECLFCPPNPSAIYPNQAKLKLILTLFIASYFDGRKSFVSAQPINAKVNIEQQQHQQQPALTQTTSENINYKKYDISFRLNHKFRRYRYIK